MPPITINASKCNNCQYCVQVCPWGIFVSKQNTSIPTIVNETYCVSCGHCIAICPNEAIEHSDIEGQRIHPITGIWPTDSQLLHLMKTRRSIRVFQKKTVEPTTIKKIIEGSNYAPSTNNEGNIVYLIIQNEELIDQITQRTAQYLSKTIKLFQNPVVQSIYSILSKSQTKTGARRLAEYKQIITTVEKGKDSILHEAPVLIIFTAPKNIAFSDVNVSLAVQNAALLTHSLGLGCFYAGYVVVASQHDDHLARLIGVPKEYKPYGALALGYPELKFLSWIEKKKPVIQWID